MSHHLNPIAMIIRPIQAADIKAVAVLFDAYRVFYNKASDLAAAEKFLTARFQQNESELFVAATSSNELVGFVQLYPLFSSTRMKRLWLLNDLFVDEAFRRKGISVLLINAAKELCKKTDACGFMLETEKSNLIGNNLYVKVGLSLDADHNYYSWES